MYPSRQRPYRYILRLFVVVLLPLLGGCDSDPLTAPESEAVSDGTGAIPQLFVPEPGSAPNFAVSLDGSGDLVDMNPAPVGTPASITVEAWVKLAETDKTHALVSLARDDFNDGIALWVNPSNRALFNVAASSAVKGQAVATTVLEPDVWYHVAGVYDAGAGVIRIFVNGVEEASASYTGGISYNLFRELRLGTQIKRPNRDLRFLKGALDEVRIWNFPRSGEEIAADMSFEIEPATGLVGYWRFNEGDGRTAADLSGNDNTGILFGDVSWTEATWRQQRVMEVPIDVLPWQDRNFIVTFQFIVSVAVLSTEDFDAARDVDRASLTFGRTGDEQTLLMRPRRGRRAARPLCRGLDVDRDGRRDLLCLFGQRGTGLTPEDTEAVLKGRTTEGMDIVGRDQVIIWRPGPWWR